MYGCGNCRMVTPGIHKLQQCHLCRCILHRNTIGTEVDIVCPPLVGLFQGKGRAFCIEQVGIQDLFGERQRPAGYFAGCRNAFSKCSIYGTNQIEIKQHFLFSIWLSVECVVVVFVVRSLLFLNMITETLMGYDFTERSVVSSLDLGF